MPYFCHRCSVELSDDHLLGQAVGSIPNARVCSEACANSLAGSYREKTDWTWLPVSEWTQKFRKGLQDHPFYIQPADNEVIWRYLDLPKFLDLLLTSQLYLTAAHRLGDPFEGALSQCTISRFETQASKVAAEIAEALGAYDAVAGRAQILRGLRGDRQWERQWTYVNCWHINAFESAAMWAAYGRSSDAIAIKSNVGRLRSCVEHHQEPPFGFPLVARVQYRDYSKESVETGFVLAPLLQKRMSFKHENELRIIVQQLPLLGQTGAKGGLYDFSKSPVHGIRLEIDLQALIEEIFVAPESSPWFLNVVQSITTQFGLNMPVRQSELLEGTPVF